jgi:hypothetical protein
MPIPLLDQVIFSMEAGGGTYLDVPWVFEHWTFKEVLGR